MKYLVIVSVCFFAFFAHAQEVHQELKETVRAEVLRILHEEKQDIIDIGYDDYIIKPIDMNLLLKKISRFLDK